MIYQKITVLLLFTFHFLSCDNKADKLQTLDRLVFPINNLEHFTSLKVSNKFINHQAVCNLEYELCKEHQNNYLDEIKKIGLSLDSFNNIQSQMNELKLIAYFKQEKYSFWVKGGGLGDIHGFVIKHNNTDNLKKQFILDGKHSIEVGREIKNNIYYFSG